MWSLTISPGRRPAQPMASPNWSPNGDCGLPHPDVFVGPSCPFNRRGATIRLWSCARRRPGSSRSLGPCQASALTPAPRRTTQQLLLAAPITLRSALCDRMTTGIWRARSEASADSNRWVEPARVPRRSPLIFVFLLRRAVESVRESSRCIDPMQASGCTQKRQAQSKAVLKSCNIFRKRFNETR